MHSRVVTILFMLFAVSTANAADAREHTGEMITWRPVNPLPLLLNEKTTSLLAEKRGSSPSWTTVLPMHSQGASACAT